MKTKLNCSAGWHTLGLEELTQQSSGSLQPTGKTGKTATITGEHGTDENGDRRRTRNCGGEEGSYLRPTLGLPTPGLPTPALCRLM